MDEINEYLKKHYKYQTIRGRKYPELTKRIVCKDGFEISVQASSGHYSEPRENEAWPYISVELGYPNSMDNLIQQYAEDPDTKDTVFGYVPIVVVNKLIEGHGGLFKD